MPSALGALPLPALMREANHRTATLLEQARRHFGIRLPVPDVHFDLRGKAAGQVRLAPGMVWQVRYNATLMAREPDAFLAQTVPHEVAHLIAFALHGRGIRPHGDEWRAVMRHLGAEPTRCHRFAVDDLPTRRLRRFDYHCPCRAHQLSSTRHHRALAGQTYYCVACRRPLVPGPVLQPPTPDLPSTRPGGRK